MHCRIHTRDKTTLLATSSAIAACNGLMNAGVIVMRSKKRHIETLVNMRVAKVYDSSGQQYHAHGAKSQMYLKPFAIRKLHEFLKLMRREVVRRSAEPICYLYNN